ncbi:MAG: MFS transporter, partial [Acidimicrobiia bacterium]|nr:MFS transporter [Acidimicrobiia bacterium]
WLLAGQSFGPAVGGILADSFDWRWSLGAAGVAAALVAVGLWLLPVGTIATGEESTGSGEQVDEHLKNPSRQAIAFLYLLPAVQFALGGAILQTLVPIVADGELAIGPATVGLALGVGGVARLAGALVAGQVTDRVSRRWALVPSQVIQAAGVAVFAMATTRALWLVAILLMTFGSVGVHVGATILADLSEASTLGRRLGVFRFTGDAAFMVAPALSGWLYSTSGRVWATVPMLVLAVVVAAGVTLWVPETASDRT